MTRVFSIFSLESISPDSDTFNPSTSYKLVTPKRNGADVFDDHLTKEGAESQLNHLSSSYTHYVILEVYSD